MGVQIVAISVQSYWAAPITITSVFDVAVPPLGVYPINMLTYANETYKRPLPLFVIAGDWKQQVPIRSSWVINGSRLQEEMAWKLREKLWCWSGKKQNKVWVGTARWEQSACWAGIYVKCVPGDLEACICWNVQKINCDGIYRDCQEQWSWSGEQGEGKGWGAVAGEAF